MLRSSVASPALPQTAVSPCVRALAQSKLGRADAVRGGASVGAGGGATTGGGGAAAVPGCSETGPSSLVAASGGAAGAGWLTLASVANAYFLVVDSQDRLRIARENVAAASRILKLINQRLQAGTTSQLEVSQQESLVATQRATIPLLEITLRQNVVALAVLVAQLVRMERRAPEGVKAERDAGRLALVAGAVLAFVTAAIPLQLDREWITLGWALLAAALVAL